MKTGQQTRITTGPKTNYLASYSPDGKWITFISDRDGKPHVYIMKADGTHITQLTKGNTWEHTPNWSVDGHIYFASNAGGSMAGKWMDFWSWKHANIWKIKVVLPEPLVKPQDPPPPVPDTPKPATQ